MLDESLEPRLARLLGALRQQPLVLMYRDKLAGEHQKTEWYERDQQEPVGRSHTAYALVNDREHRPEHGRVRKNARLLHRLRIRLEPDEFPRVGSRKPGGDGPLRFLQVLFARPRHQAIADDVKSICPVDAGV